MFEDTTHNRNGTISHRRLVPKELKAIRQAFGTDLGYRHVNINYLFELDRIAIVALSVNARPADCLPVDFANHSQIDAAQQRVLGLFHISEEVGEVNDPGGVGVAEFNSSLSFEDLPHWNLDQVLSDTIWYNFKRCCDESPETNTSSPNN